MLQGVNSPLSVRKPSRWYKGHGRSIASINAKQVKSTPSEKDIGVRLARNGRWNDAAYDLTECAGTRLVAHSVPGSRAQLRHPLHPPVTTALRGLAKVLVNSGGIITAGVLSCVYAYSRLQGRESQIDGSLGINRQPSHGWWPSLQHRLVSTALARHRMRFHMADGSRIDSRIVDSGGLLSVYADRDYDITGLGWSALRTIVDVGAHVGSFTVWAAKRSSSARILAIEPNPETFTLLTQNLRNNGLRDRVIAINAAVGANSGASTLELMEHSLGTRLGRHGQTEGSVVVRVERLEALLEHTGIEVVDLLKMDCEGMEYEIFESMRPNYLQRIQSIACEYHLEPGHDIQHLDRLLRAAGFRTQRPDTPVGIIWATR